MEDEVVRFAKKMDKMVQKKNAVSAAVGAGRKGGRAGAEAGSRRGIPSPSPSPPPAASLRGAVPGAPASPGGCPGPGCRVPRPPALGPDRSCISSPSSLVRRNGSTNDAGALDLLKELKNIPMTLELLQSTRIGMSVNAIRKQSTDEEVTSLAKSLIKSWKKLLDGPSTEKDLDEKKKEPAITSQNSPEAREESGNVSNRKDERNARDTYVSSFPRAPSTSDSVRLKCREMLAAALRTGDDYIAIGADEEELGSQIEEDILFEMASDELKEMRKNLTKEAIREHQMAKTGGTQTDLFTCGKCKKKNCTYTQVEIP
ncbi:Transcription elongation factor A protein 1 [Saguinus oedipus]|uniref:Transcription elongation factor A protein 1 n=1 Tax=Saguinus oedipus TaxID=9490 RepID=A0ABQ9UCG0_SAGOE|nr:Transcription elongation factor A protein 1 [Saguinus oedipus]